MREMMLYLSLNGGNPRRHDDERVRYEESHEFGIRRKYFEIFQKISGTILFVPMEKTHFLSILMESSIIVQKSLKLLCMERMLSISDVEERAEIKEL